MMNTKEPRSKSLRRRSVICAGGFLAGTVLSILAGAGLDIPAHAQEQKPLEYRVGDLIQSGNFADPQGWKLEGFHVEKATGSISRKGEEGRWGTATTTFQGPDGYYKIRIRYQDEGDGISQASLDVGGKTVGSWAFDGIMINTYRWKEFDGVKIDKGDEIVLRGRGGGYEYCRFTGIEILPSKPRPKVADATAIEKKEYSMNLVPVNVNPAARDNRKYLVGAGRLFAGGTGTYWVYLKQGQPFRLTARASRGGGTPSLQYSFTKVGADQPLAEETIESEDGIPIFVDVRDAEEGLYELRVSPVPGDKTAILVDFEAPGVTIEGLSEGYFFVPKGTRAFSVKGRGHVVMQNAAGEAMFDDWFEKDTTILVEVTEGSDNQIWYFQGPLSNLAGIPPYVTARRDAVLAPKEVLQ